MANFLDIISSAITPTAVDQISKSMGIENKLAQTAIASAIPVLINALAGNTSDRSGAESLSNALSKDHDGSILDDLGSLIGNPQQYKGGGILGHVLGSKRATVENFLGQSSGLPQQQAGGLMEILAPMIMGALGKTQRQEHLGPGALNDLLINAQRDMTQKAPAELGMIGKLLDQDGDGSMMDDVANIGMSLLNNFFKK